MLTQMIRLTKTQKSHVAVPLSVKRNVFFHCSAFECYCFELNLLKLVSLSCYRSMSLLKIYAIKLFFVCCLLLSNDTYTDTHINAHLFCMSLLLRSCTRTVFRLRESFSFSLCILANIFDILNKMFINIPVPILSPQYIQFMIS